MMRVELSPTGNFEINHFATQQSIACRVYSHHGDDNMDDTKMNLLARELAEYLVSNSPLHYPGVSQGILTDCRVVLTWMQEKGVNLDNLLSRRPTTQKEKP